MNTNPEQLLISSLLRNEDIALALRLGIKTNMFHAYPEEWQWIENFYLQRSKTPSKAAFAVNFPTFRIKQADDTEHFVDEVINNHTIHEVMDTALKVVEQAKGGNGREALNQMFASSMKINSDLGLVIDGDVIRDHDDIMADFAIRRERLS